MLPSSQAGEWFRRGLAVARSSLLRRRSVGGGCGGHNPTRGSLPITFIHQRQRHNFMFSCCSRSSFFSSHAAALVDREDTSCSNNDFDNEEIAVRVESDGGQITLQFDNGNKVKSESTYHASWLWSNDPRRVVLPSGQRMSTPGQYRANDLPRIINASIIHCNIETTEEMSTLDGSSETTKSSSTESNEKVMVPGPTMEDSCHPLAIYGKYPAWIMSTTTSADATKGDSTDKNDVRPYLKVAWSTSQQTSENNEIHISSTTTSVYDIEWLQRFQYNDSSRFEHRSKTEVRPIHAIRNDGRPPLWYSTPAASSISDLTSSYAGEEEEMLKHDDNGLMHINYQSIIGNNNDGHTSHNEGLFRLLHSVFRDGAAIVSNTPHSATSTNKINVSQLCQHVETMPENDLPVSKVAKLMSNGYLSHGALYGDTFHVRVGERGANNVAYTSSALPPHQDLAYYESPPGMQLLHCVVMGGKVVGGESTLIDAMAAAHKLRELTPESFETLVKCAATFVKQRDGACMTYRRPHIVLAEDGGSDEAWIDREITAVYWSPPFEGPVSLHPEMVNRYYEAYADFERLLNGSSDGNDDDGLSRYASEFTWEHKLNPGEMLVFNNRRMVHGRRGFSSAEGSSFEESQRHLVGCYTNIDDTLNSYRVLLRERGMAATSILNVGNGTNIIP